MRAIDRWAEAFIAVCAGAGGSAPLSEAAFAEVRDGLAVLGAAGGVFGSRFRYKSGAQAARDARGALERALKRCDYSGGSRGIEAALSLLFLLIQKNHGTALPALCAEIEARAKKHAGILRVRIETPEAASPDFLKAAGEALMRKTGAAAVEFEERVVPELLGGCRIITGSDRFDYSLAGSIRRFEKSLNVEAAPKGAVFS